jgi:hypothetical protein
MTDEKREERVVGSSDVGIDRRGDQARVAIVVRVLFQMPLQSSEQDVDITRIFARQIHQMVRYVFY